MHSNGLGTFVILLAVLLAVMMVTVDALPVTAGHEGSNPECDPKELPTEIVWAENVRDHQLGESVGADFSDPGAALGECDAVSGESGFYSMGNALDTLPEPPVLPSTCEAYLIVDFGEHFIFDGEGDDIHIFEVATNGVAESTWVYVGREEEETQVWLYAGQTGGSADTIDLSNVGQTGEVFNLLALCDFPNKNSTGHPWGGPDIDAIAALHTRRTGLAAEADGPGWSKNEEPLARGETTPLDEEDELTFDCPDSGGNDQCQDSDLNVKVQCIDTEELFVLLLRSPELFADKASSLMIIKEVLPGFEEVCGEDNALILGPQNPMAVFSIEEGYFDFSVEDDMWRFRLDTPVAQVGSAGTNDFSIRYDSQDNEARIRVSAGALTVDPSAAGEDPFDLQAGQQVIINADGAGPVIDLAFSYLPLTVR